MSANWGLFEALTLWVVWWYPFLFRAPHWQKRPSITVAGPTRIGLILETLAIVLAAAFQPGGVQWLSPLRLAGCGLCGVIGIVTGWTAVLHLGRQFRIHAGLYEDHELVRSGPYAVVRHPIYASLLAMLLCTMFVRTPWSWWPLPLLLFIIGTEIRVRSEDGLLRGRFGANFEEYRRSTAAYVPLLR